MRQIGGGRGAALPVLTAAGAAVIEGLAVGCAQGLHGGLRLRAEAQANERLRQRVLQHIAPAPIVRDLAGCLAAAAATRSPRQV